MTRITNDRDPLDWYIEICIVCGCQLGPGVGSRTDTGRCVIPEHGKYGSVVVKVQSKPLAVQEKSSIRTLERLGVR